MLNQISHYHDLTIKEENSRGLIAAMHSFEERKDYSNTSPKDEHILVVCLELLLAINCSMDHTSNSIPRQPQHPSTNHTLLLLHATTLQCVCLPPGL